MRLKLPVLFVFAFVCFFSALPRIESQTLPSSNFGGLLGASYYATGGAGSNPLVALTTGDFNHDGSPDLATLTPVGNVEVFLNDGKGGLKAPLVSDLQLNGPGSYTLQGKIVAADLNGDGYDDLVIGIGGYSQASTLFVALNQKDGTFATATALPVPFSYNNGAAFLYSFTVGRTTASGYLDIVAAGPGVIPFENVYQIATYLNDGSGGFSKNIFSSYPVSDPDVCCPLQQSFGETVALADANHDGKADLFVLRQGFESGAIYADVLLGAGDGSFDDPSGAGAVSLPPPAIGPGPVNLAVTDLTGSASKQDIVIANSDGVWVALSNGDGTYQTPTAQVNFYSTYGVAAVDLNGDGKPDLIISGDGGQSIYLGKGDGTFLSLTGAYVAGSNSPYILNGYPSLSPAIADFNGDGIPDFASADLQIGGIEVASGNGDGTFQATPLLTSTASPVLATGSIATSLVADLNGDGLDDIVANDFLAATPQIITGLADGHGGFKYQTALAASYPVDYVEPIRADFNGDGKQDVVIAGSDGSAAVALSNGDGTLKTPVPISLGETLACPIGTGATGDLNGDNKLDLVFPYTGDMYCNKGSAVPSGYFVALGNGDGTFQPASFTPYGTYLASLALGVFHGSTKPLDLVASDYNASVGVSLLTGKGDGTFGAPSVVTSTQLAYQELTNDFNQDGNADLTLIGYTFPSAPTGSINGAVLWYPGKGDGTFGPPVTLYPEGFAFEGVYSDLNGDGFPDLIVASANGLSVLLGAGGGSFAAPINYFSPAYASPLAGNFLGDNTQSILAFAGISGGTGFYKNLGGTSLAAVPSASSITVGDSLSLTATLTATLAGRPAPSGTITFLDGTTAIGNTAVGGTVTTSSLAAGSHSITVAYSGDANFNPNTSVPVAVTVAALPPDFTIAPSAATLTVTKGQSGTLTLTVTPNATLSGSSTFSCTGLPSEAACSFSPATLSVAAGKAGTATVTVTTKAASSAAVAKDRGMGLVGVFAAVCVVAIFPKRRSRWLAVFVVVAGFGALAGLGGCGGGSSPPITPTDPGTPTGNSTVTVSATVVSGSTSVTHSTTFTLTVQ